MSDGIDISGNISYSIRGSMRTTKAYTITETELMTLPDWKNSIKEYDTIIMSCISFATALILQSIFATELSYIGLGFIFAGLPLTALVGGFHYIKRKKLVKESQTIIDIIKNETVHE